MKRGSLDPEDRKVFDDWARAVTAFYSLLVVGLLTAALFSPREPAIEKAAVSIGDIAAGRHLSRERHP